MMRPTRLIQCASAARQLDQGPHRRISIRASGKNLMLHKQAGHMKATDHAFRQKRLAKGGNGMDPALGLGWNVKLSTVEQETSMQIVRIGLDLAKYVFHLHGVDERG
ncbi:MAG: hypothetical protein ACR65Z_07375, partial [Methylocystis sp.]